MALPLASCRKLMRRCSAENSPRKVTLLFAGLRDCALSTQFDWVRAQERCTCRSCKLSHKPQTFTNHRCDPKTPQTVKGNKKQSSTSVQFAPYLRPLWGSNSPDPVVSCRVSLIAPRLKAAVPLGAWHRRSGPLPAETLGGVEPDQSWELESMAGRTRQIRFIF